MRRRDEPSPLVILGATLLASLVMHLLLWPLGDRVIKLSWDAPPLPTNGGWMQVALVEPEAEAPPEPEAPPRQVEAPGKLIKQDRVRKESVPDQTPHVAEFDQKVERESRAAQGRAKAGAAPSVAGTAPDADNLPPAPKLLSPRPEPPAGAREGDEADEGRGDPAPPRVPSPRALLPLRPELGSGGRPGLRGDPAERSPGAPGEHGTMDDIQDVEDGDVNMLNSRRWKYASFFNRVRDQVAEKWQPNAVMSLRDPDGRRFGLQTRITRLLIRLNPDGSLKQVQLDRSSGVDVLDEEAIRAVRAAQPFRNPPAQLVDPTTGFIDFGFLFELSDAGKGKIFRYRR